MPTVAYRVTRSRRKFVKAPEIKKRLGELLDSEVKPHFIEEFERRVVNWEHKPDFKARKFIRIDKIWLDVFPTGPNKAIWKYISFGTRAHIIRAKIAPVLAFQLGYKPKTKPPGKFGGPGVATGDRVFAKSVRHPGTAPREFEKYIAKDNKKWFSRTMENGWRRILRAV